LENVTLDRYLDLGIETVGGISLNYAINARACGAFSALVSCTGDDHGCVAVRNTLTTASVDASHLYSLPGRTASQAIRMAPGGERIFPAGGYDPGILSQFQLSAADLAFVQQFDYIALAYFAQIVHLSEAILKLPDLQAQCVVDLLDGSDLGQDLRGIERLLDHVAIAFISGDDATIEQLLPNSRNSHTIIVVTHGAFGSSVLTNGQIYSEPAVLVANPVDTTGCGDAFQAAFTVHYFHHHNLQLALQAGAQQAACVLQHYGATKQGNLIR
jgi:sugar/nucleoside kinase (ribokinase family)